MQIGTITDVRFQRVTCTSEAGMVVAGSMDSTIEGLVLEDVAIELVQQTDFAGGFLDYRPGMRGIVDDVQTSAIFIEFANHVNLSNVEARPLLTCHATAAVRQVPGVSEFRRPLPSLAADGLPAHSTLSGCHGNSWGADLLRKMQVVWGKPPRPEWGQALEITPRTVHATSVTVSAHVMSMQFEHPQLWQNCSGPGRLACSPADL